MNEMIWLDKGKKLTSEAIGLDIGKYLGQIKKQSFISIISEDKNQIR